MSLNQTPLELTGSPGSPYSRKMLGLLRFKRIPYTVHWGSRDVPEGYPRPKVFFMPTFFFPDGENGQLVAVTDSTPIIRRLENEYPARSVIPTDPVLCFLNALIEDYADEWLTKAMFGVQTPCPRMKQMSLPSTSPNARSNACMWSVPMKSQQKQSKPPIRACLVRL